ncbi:MAG: sigma-70 family RNA polymerase sigma factor [Myxococcota bacterium]
MTRPIAPVRPGPDLQLIEGGMGPLYERYRGLILRRVSRFARGEIAEELAQEAFTVAMARWSQFRGETSRISWLYQIATRIGLHHVRDLKRRRVLLETHGPPDWAVGVHESSVDARIFLNQVWSTLDEELTEIGVYHYLDGMTHAEIARMMRVSRRTIGNRIATLVALVKAAATVEDSRGY